MMKIQLAIVSGLMMSHGTHATTLDVGLVDADRPPYFVRPTHHTSVSGMYIDILDEIGKQAGITFNYKFLPQKRIRAYMKIGLLDVEPGIDPQWRTNQGEAESTVYSDSLFESPEVLVYNPSKFPVTPSHEELMQHKSCTVLGFNSVQETKSKEYALTTEEQIIDLIKLQRCDWAIFPVDVINNDSSFGRLKYTEPVATYSLSIRLSKKHTPLLEPINEAIREMKQSGKLHAIIHSYTAGD